MIILEMEITRHSNDVIMKTVARTFKDKTLKVFGLDVARIVDLVPTEVPVVEIKERRTDFIFLLEDGTLLHLEFQTTASERDMKRFLLYDARLINRDDRDIQTAVVYSGEIEQAPDLLVRGSITYRVTNVYMKGYDGDREHDRLGELIIKGEALSEEDILKLIFLPLMKSEKTGEEMAIQAGELGKAIKGEIRPFVLGALVALTDRILTVESKRKLREVLSMTQIEQWIREEGEKIGREEGIKEGIKEGIQEGIQEGRQDTARAALRKGLPEELVADITGLDRETIQKLKAGLN